MIEPNLLNIRTLECLAVSPGDCVTDGAVAHSCYPALGNRITQYIISLGNHQNSKYTFH